MSVHNIIYLLSIYWITSYKVGLVKEVSVPPFHRRKPCGDRVYTDGLAIVGLVKKVSAPPFHRQKPCGDRVDTDGLAKEIIIIV
jgi:hypothetical protein